jgi:hypothetical protein
MRKSLRSKSPFWLLLLPILLGILLIGNGLAQASELIGNVSGKTHLPLILNSYDGTTPPPSPLGPTISTASPLPAGTLGVSYSQTLQASGGTIPYTWAITGSVLLPTGLSLDSGTGVISGIPVSAGTTSFQVKVTDANALSTTKNFSLTVNPAPASGPTITTESPLPAGIKSANYSQTLQASGGTTPYTWSITGSNLLPTGLSLNPNTGVISGTPANTATATFQVKVTDANTQFSTKEFSLTVANQATTSGAPTPPSELITTPLSSTSIGLDWKDNSNNETNFEIEHANDVVNFAFYPPLFPAVAGTGPVSGDDGGLTQDTFHCYRIRAINASGKSAYTNTACAWTQATVVPRAPTYLNAQALSSTQILLTWTNNSQSDEYRVYESVDNGPFVFAGPVPQDNVPGAYINGLSAGHSYRYYIQAHNTFGYSANSNISVAVITPGGSASTVRIVNNSSYPIISLTIDGVQKFPQAPQGIPPGTTYEIPITTGGHSYQAINGFWNGTSRFEMYHFNGTWTQPAGAYTITINNPTISQLLTKFSSSGYYLGEYWSGTNFHYKGFRFYNTGTYNYYLDGALAGTGTYSLAPGGYPGSYTVTFNVTGAQAATGYYSETGGTFYMKNGPSDWPVIYYNDAGH